MRSTTVCGATPDATSMAISDGCTSTSGPTPLRTRLAAAKVSKDVNRVGATEKLRSSAWPTTVSSRVPPGPSTVMVSPMAKPSSSSLALATASPSASGRRPALRLVGAPGPPSV